MLNSLFIAIGGIIGLMLIWIIVQSAWKRVFAANVTDDDVLAGRSSCGNCGCGTICQIDGKKRETDNQEINAKEESYGTLSGL